MPAEKNTLARIVVPVIALAIGIATVWAVFRNSQTKPAATPAPPATTAATTPATPADGAAQATGSGAPATTEPAGTPAVPTISAAPEPKAEPTPAPTGLRARRLVGAAAFEPIGSTDRATGFEAQYAFSPLGAGVERITLANHFQTLKDKVQNQERFHVQEQIGSVGKSGETYTTVSLAARAVIIDGTAIDLFGDAENTYWTQTAPGTFVCEIEDASGAVVARVTRRYELVTKTYEIKVHQSFENLSGRDSTIQWVQYGPLDIQEEMFGYRLDMRRVRYGYLLTPARDPSQSIVESDRLLEGHAKPIAAAEKAYAATNNLASRNAILFPRAAEFSGAGDLVWAAQTSRYFAFAVHPLLTPGSTTPGRLLIASEVYGVPIGWGTDTRLALELHSAPVTVKAGSSADLSFGAYAGPLAKSYLTDSADPVYRLLNLTGLVVFNLGGCCAFCTFQWLAQLLLWYLELVHWALSDWSLAIIILVFTVRAILHPVTRRAQINMTRFGKKMAALAPKQKKLQEQFAGDPKQMQVEMARLMREEGVSPTQALGCLPTFLQTPVWIALYAMLYFAFQFRHEPAFYGVFQGLTGGRWTFLADLSAPDHLIEFGRTFHIPLISGLMGDITGINVLPLVLGVVFFIQQKYMTPPSTTTLTPEQEMQQKMMKVMIVVMFPIMMYNAPSGLAIYFITNSTLGILESRWIRAHIDELDKNPPSTAPGTPLWARKKVANEAKGGGEPAPRRFKER